MTDPVLVALVEIWRTLPLDRDQGQIVYRIKIEQYWQTDIDDGDAQNALVFGAGCEFICGRAHIAEPRYPIIVISWSGTFKPGELHEPLAFLDVFPTVTGGRGMKPRRVAC